MTTMALNAAYLRAKRAEAKRNGLCGQCRKREPASGLVTCAECLRARELRERAKQLGPDAWCVECQRGDGAHRLGCRRRVPALMRSAAGGGGCP